MANTDGDDSVGRLSNEDVLKDLGFIADGGEWGGITYTATYTEAVGMRGAGLAVIATDTSGARRAFLLPEHAVDEVEV